MGVRRGVFWRVVLFDIYFYCYFDYDFYVCCYFKFEYICGEIGILSRRKCLWINECSC